MECDNESGRDHATEDGEPCSECQLPKSWIDEVPKNWRHVPWDAVELKKHQSKGKTVGGEEDDVLFERPAVSDDEVTPSPLPDDRSQGERSWREYRKRRLHSRKGQSQEASDSNVKPPPVPRDEFSEQDNQRSTPETEKRKSPKSRFSSRSKSTVAKYVDGHRLEKEIVTPTRHGIRRVKVRLLLRVKSRSRSANVKDEKQRSDKGNDRTTI